MDSPRLTSLGEGIENGSSAVGGMSGSVVAMVIGTVVSTAVVIIMRAATESDDDPRVLRSSRSVTRRSFSKRSEVGDS
jgi:hypothetical protein